MQRHLIAFTVGLIIALSPTLTQAQTTLTQPVVQPSLLQLSTLPPLASEPTQPITYLTPTNGTLSSGYGRRWGRMHQGIDIAAPVGTPIHAAAAGRIEFVGSRRGYGLVVEIRHPDGSRTLYAHNSENLVAAGEQVEQGQIIAEVGATGRATGPHLHFEIHRPGLGSVNPAAYLQNIITQSYSRSHSRWDGGEAENSPRASI